jgi:cysteine desulfurase
MAIYFDHNATTPVDPRVRQAMLPYLEQDFGNPSSNTHAFGWKAQMAVDRARKQVASVFSVAPKTVVWTSGATESNNLAILGALEFWLESEEKPHFITTAVEHKAVLQVFDWAKKRGAEVSVAPVDKDGCIELSTLKSLIQPNTRLISVMAANNEIGSVNALKEIGELCSENKIVFHCDCAQAVGRMPLSFENLKIDLLSLSGHKIYGPKGVGALIVRAINREFSLRPLMAGGEQECGLRPGTLNVPGIVGLGVACEILQAEMESEIEKLSHWQRQVLETVQTFPEVVVNGPLKNRLCNNVSFSVKNLFPDEILEGLDGFAFSSGSACTSANAKPSHVLKAIGREDQLARSTIRLGFGRFNTDAEIGKLLSQLKILIGQRV